MHVDNTSSFQQGDPPQPGEGALRHHCGDYDLKKIKQIYTDELKERNIKIEFIHVKAHQDETKNRPKNKDGTIPPLTQAALLNIDCDACAEKCYDELPPSNKRILPHTSIQHFRIKWGYKHRQTFRANSTRPPWTNPQRIHQEKTQIYRRTI